MRDRKKIFFRYALYYEDLIILCQTYTAVILPYIQECEGCVFECGVCEFLCILCLCILGIHELCLEKIWLYNLPSERVDAGSCVTHIKNEQLYSLNIRLTPALCQFFSWQGLCTGCLKQTWIFFFQIAIIRL